MGLFSKKVEVKKDERVLEFNKDKLQKDLNNLSSRLFDYRKDLGLEVLVEVINLAKNIAVLEIASSSDEKKLMLQKGRLAAFGDLLAYIEQAIVFHKQVDKEAPRGTVKMARRANTASL